MAHPHLDARRAERRARRKRILIGAAIILVITIVLIAVVWRQAGIWGVPGFSFTDQHGSKCTNTFVGHECDMTEEHVSAITETEFPEEAEMLSGIFTEAGTWSMTARFRIPEAATSDVLGQLNETFGDCVEHAPSTLRTEPGLTDFCVRTNASKPSEVSQAGSWSVASALEEGSGSTLIQLDLNET